MTLKNKAAKGFSWTILEGVFSQGFLFIVGVVLARLLTPEDFGVIAVITSLMAISNSIIEGGFGSALIRKINANQKDYNTVFYVNLIVGLILYIIVVITSSFFAEYFQILLLKNLLKYAGLLLIINSFTIIQRTLLTKKLDFKEQALISIFASVVSGTIAIMMAYSGYGIWSLIILVVLKPFINSILLWYKSNWRPKLIFSRSSFMELFGFGYKLLVANFINTLYLNIYSILIAKYFSPITLGFYSRADQFQKPFSSNITMAIRRISFPVLSMMQDDRIKLKKNFIRFLRFSQLINFTIMLGIAAMAKPIVILLIGEKWEESIYYLQLLCIPGMLYPLQVLHLNLLLVKGYSNLNLKLEVIKKIILVPLIFSALFLGLKAMLYGLIIFAIIEYFINSFYSNKLISYPIKEQLHDILPFLTIAIIVAATMLLPTLLSLPLFIILLLQLSIGFLTFIITNEIIKTDEYLEIKNRFFNILKNVNKKYDEKN